MSPFRKEYDVVSLNHVKNAHSEYPFEYVINQYLEYI
jgi:hypothetical protein